MRSSSSYVVHRAGIVTVSVMNIILAVASISLDVYVLASNPLFPSAEHTRVQGIWCGIFYLSAGFAGLLIISKTTKVTLLFALIASLLSVVFAAVSLGLTASDGCLHFACDDSSRAIGVSLIACSFLVMMVSLVEIFLVSMTLFRKTQPSPASMADNLTIPSLQKLPDVSRSYR